MAEAKRKQELWNLKTQSKLEENHVKWISNFIESHEKEHYSVSTIQERFNEFYQEELTISNSTVKRVLKNKLGMVYKKLERINKKASGKSSIRSFCEALTLQLELLNDGYELIYIDEFSISSRRNPMYGWWRKGFKRYTYYFESPFCMSFIVAFSSSKFYAIMGVNGTINAAIFGLFLKRLTESMQEYRHLNTNKQVLVFDNAPIHKANHIKKLLVDANITIITITPYEPSLNAAEKLILAIKSKIKTRQYQGKMMSLASVKAVADEVSNIRLSGLVEATFKESLEKMKAYLM